MPFVVDYSADYGLYNDSLHGYDKDMPIRVQSPLSLTTKTYSSPSPYSYDSYASNYYSYEPSSSSSSSGSPRDRSNRNRWDRMNTSTRVTEYNDDDDEPALEEDEGYDFDAYNVYNAPLRARTRMTSPYSSYFTPSTHHSSSSSHSHSHSYSYSSSSSSYSSPNSKSKSLYPRFSDESDALCLDSPSSDSGSDETDEEADAHAGPVPGPEPYTPSCSEALRRQWYALELRVRFGVFRARRRVRTKVRGLLGHGHGQRNEERYSS